MTARWGIENLAAVQGNKVQRRAAFERVPDPLRRRIGAFASLPLEVLDGLSLAFRLKGIGARDGTTTRRPNGA